jgi:hypothetical protein
MVFISKSIIAPSVERPVNAHLLPGRRLWTLVTALLLTYFWMSRPLFGLALTDDNIRRAIAQHIGSETDLSHDQIDINVNDGLRSKRMRTY